MVKRTKGPGRKGRARSDSSSDGSTGTSADASRRTTRANTAAAEAATAAAAAPANGNQALLLALQGLEPASIKALLEAATTSQIDAAANATATAMTGRGSSQTEGGRFVTPQAPSPRGMEPSRMQEVMDGRSSTTQGTNDASPPPTANGRGGGRRRSHSPSQTTQTTPPWSRNCAIRQRSSKKKTC